MLHFVPDSRIEPAGAPYAEAVARLASIRQALRIVEPFGAGPANDLDEAEIAAAWPTAGAAKQRCFDARSGRTVAAAAAGLEAVVEVRELGVEPNDAALQALADEIRSGLEDLAHLMNG